MRWIWPSDVGGAVLAVENPDAELLLACLLRRTNVAQRRKDEQ